MGPTEKRLSAEWSRRTRFSMSDETRAIMAGQMVLAQALDRMAELWDLAMTPKEDS
jgi:hypothetical protein